MLQCSSRNTRSLVYAGFLLAASLTPAFAADVTGDWKVEEEVAVIRVANCNGTVWGAVVWEKIPGGIDKNNPDKAKRTRPTLGMLTLLNMKQQKSGDAKWQGKVYNAKDGKIYDASIKLEDANHLEIEGCVLGFLCGGQTWTRVADPKPASATPVTPPTGATKTAPAAPKASGAAAPGSSAPGSNTMAKKGATPPSPPAAATASGDVADPVGDVCLLPDVTRTAH